MDGPLLLLLLRRGKSGGKDYECNLEFLRKIKKEVRPASWAMGHGSWVNRGAVSCAVSAAP